MNGLMGKDHSKEKRSEEKKKKMSKSSKENVHMVITSTAGVQEMENGDLGQEGRRLFLDDKAKRKEKMLIEVSKARSKHDQGVVKDEQQQPDSRSMPVTQDTADNFVNEDFDANLNSNGAVKDGSESKVQSENSPNGSRNHLQSVSHVLPSPSQCSEQETNRVSSHTSHCKTIINETDIDIEQALIFTDVLGDTSQVSQGDTPCGGPSQAVIDSCSVTDPELDCSNTSGGAHSRIDDNCHSHINTPSGHQQELAAEGAPLVDQDTVEDSGQTDHGLLPSHASEGVCGRCVEGTSSGDQATATSATAVPDTSLAANSVSQHGYLATESRPKKPSTGDDLSSNAVQMDSPYAGYITDSSSSYPSFPPSQTSKPESATPSAMQIVPGLNQKEEAKRLTVDDQLISKAVTDNTLLLEKLSKYLDRESRVIKCWKHLAFVLKVPAEETRKFDMYTEHSPTEDMINYLAENWRSDLTVGELKNTLKKIYRNDVVDSLTKGGYHDERNVADLISGQPKFIVMLSSKLDTESRTIGNWKSLATHFGIRKQVTEQFGSRGSGPTAALFQHMSTADGLKDLTMGELRRHFAEMERKDLVNILKKHNFGDSSLVRMIAVSGSELLADIGERLNKEMRAVKNWRNLAYRLKIPPEEYDAFDTSKGAAKSPTKMLFQWLELWKPNLTVKDLLTSLKQIDRYDVVDLVVKEVATFLENLKKDEVDSRQGCSDLMPVDGKTGQSTANHDLCKVQQLQQYSNNGNNKTDLINLERKATAQRLRIKDNEGQGNCMFSALCHQLEIKKRLKYSEMELRTELVQYLTDHPTFRDDSGSLLSLFNFVDHEKYPTWKKYLEKMAWAGTWGDHLILRAAAGHFNCVIHIISSRPDHEDVYIKPESISCDVTELLLGHIHEYHYVSLHPDLGVPSYPSQLPTTNKQIPVSTYAGHPPCATHHHTYGNQQSQGNQQSERYSKEVKESMIVKTLPLRIYSKICIKLNIRRDWSFDDFRMVAEELGMDRDTTEFIGQQKNPTESLFKEHCPNVTVIQLINILHKIERLDVAAILEEWIKDAQ